MVDGAANEARHGDGGRNPGGYHVGEFFVFIAEGGVFDAPLEGGAFQTLGEVAPVPFGDWAGKGGGAGREKVGSEMEELGTRLADDGEASRRARFDEHESRLGGLPGAGNDGVSAGGRDFAQHVARDDQAVGGERGRARQIDGLPIRPRQKARAAFAERGVRFEECGLKPRKNLEGRDGRGSDSGPEIEDACGRRGQAARSFGQHMRGGGVGCREAGEQVGSQFLFRGERGGGTRAAGAVVVRQ